MNKLRAFFMACLAALFVLNVAIGAPIQKLVVFGDCVSDTGNFYAWTNGHYPTTPPYYKGRFSDGPIWVDLLVAHYFPNASEQYLENYAVGGAGIFQIDPLPYATRYTLKSQLDSYFQYHPKAEPNTLYIIILSGYNYIINPSAPPGDIPFVTSGIHQQLERLANQGAQYIFVGNLFDLGKTPYAARKGIQATLSRIASAHNVTLSKMIDALKTQYTNTEWVLVDLYALLKDMTSNPGAYGLAHISRACHEELGHTYTFKEDIVTPEDADGLIAQLQSITGMPNIATQQPCDKYMFFDRVHPTKRIHELTAHELIKLIDALPE